MTVHLASYFVHISYSQTERERERERERVKQSFNCKSEHVMYYTMISDSPSFFWHMRTQCVPGP